METGADGSDIILKYSYHPPGWLPDYFQGIPKTSWCELWSFMVAFNWLCFFLLISVVFWVWFLMLRPQSVEQFRGCTCEQKNSWNPGVPSIEDARWGAGSVMLNGLVPLIADDLIILRENESRQTIVTKPPVGHPKWWWKVRESFPKSPDHSGLAICPDGWKWIQPQCHRGWCPHRSPWILEK